MENHIQKYQSNIPEKNHDGDFVEEIESTDKTTKFKGDYLNYQPKTIT